MTNLRDRIAAALGTVEVVIDGWDYLNDTSRFLLADAVIRELTEAVPPIVASAIQGYAQSGLAALSHHGDDAVIRELQLTEDGGVIVGCIHD